VTVMPLWSFYFFIFLIANIAMPGSINFIGELLVLISIFCENTFVGFFSATSCIFSAIYSLLLFNRICFGTFKLVVLKAQYFTLTWSEIYIATSLIFCNLIFGIFPNVILYLASTYNMFLHLLFEASLWIYTWKNKYVINTKIFLVWIVI
jgi:NADH-quinone oxidoreductase subunit M